MSKKKILNGFIAIVVIAALFGTISWVLSNNKEKNAAKTAVASRPDGAVAVRVYAVDTQSVAVGYKANGNFAPIQELNFSAENSGRVVKVLVDEGSYVKAGQTLAVIRTDQLEVDLSSAEAAYQNALRDKERFENAFKTGGVTRQQLDQVTLALENAEARVKQSKIRIGDANIRSSINGVVNKRMIEPGAVVAPGTPLFELVNVSRLKLNVFVNEQQVSSLKVGDRVSVEASVFPGEVFTGRISFIAPKADNALNFPVEIEVANSSSQQLKAGMFGTATFNKDASVTGLMLPRSAFVGSVNSNLVFVVNTTDSTAAQRQITSGRNFGEYVEVLDGLSAGEVVVTSGQINLFDGDKVSFIK